MDPSQNVVALSPQANMVFTVVRPVMGTVPVPPEESPSVALQQNLQTPQSADLIHDASAQAPPQDPGPDLGLDRDFGAADSGQSVERLPFAEVSSLLDPNMKGSKARKFLISYDEIRRRLQPPEKMSLRSIAAYTRVSRGPASKKTLQDSLSVLGLSPSTTTAVSSSFSKLTEGDTRALCDDMKDFSHDYVQYHNVAQQLIPRVNTVQHWSKIIETKNHLEDIRRVLQDPAHSHAFDSVTHGLGLGMVHVVLDMVSSVIQHQIRILSGSSNVGSDLAGDAGLAPPRRNRKRHRKCHHGDEQSQRTAKEAVLKAKGGGRGRKKARPDEEQTTSQTVPEQQPGGGNVLLVAVGYEAVNNELNPNANDGVTQS
ncbi:uncharacterized protein [Eucyclogobius newberryi]|uniref:uncharacterized protein n=1 Tax=Eucyclogobius newberryi TaxID=166745 RepID=UPI003B592CA3